MITNNDLSTFITRSETLLVKVPKETNNKPLFDTGKSDMIIKGTVIVSDIDNPDLKNKEVYFNKSSSTVIEIDKFIQIEDNDKFNFYFIKLDGIYFINNKE